MAMTTLIGLKIIVRLKNRFRYAGDCIAEDQYFLEIEDEHSNNRIRLSKTDVSSVEICENGKCDDWREYDKVT